MPKNKPIILIVDDTAANLQLLGGILGQDYTIKVATSGEKALEIAKKLEKPDLILLDIMMPVMDGYEVCKRLKSNHETSNIPIIFVSAKDEVKDQMRGFDLGAVDYIIKPFEPALVKARIKTHINLKFKTEMLENLAMIDGLTGIANRRKFDLIYKSEYSRALRHNKTLSIIMVDIDYFKGYNDTYGHGTGDDCLVKVANQLQDTLNREGDFLARYGGEEFVIILPELEPSGACAVADKLRESVEILNIPHTNSKIANHVTISLGCVTMTINSETTYLELLKSADDELYKAKETGRNKANCININL